jgi:hypothetical protein
MGAAKAAKADPSSTCVFSPAQGTHVSPHRDATFFWASCAGRRILVGAAYAREGNTLRIAHALAIENPTANRNTDFIIAADWNDTPEATVRIFTEANIPVVAVTPDEHTCITGNSESTIGFLITSPAIAPLLKVSCDNFVPWAPSPWPLRGNQGSPRLAHLHRPP